jgi:hypothetical protein
MLQFYVNLHILPKRDTNNSCPVEKITVKIIDFYYLTRYYVPNLVSLF